MVYELYVDSLFLVNFVMNLYLLMLVNRASLRTATRLRIVLGAGAGAAFYVMAFFIKAPGCLKWPLLLLTGTWFMLEITFRPGTFRMVLRLFGQLCQYSFLIGGVLLFAGHTLPLPYDWVSRVGGVLGMGALLYLVISYFQEKARKRQKNAMCEARLVNGEKTIRVSALMDSGNSLREPISGKPVCVISGEIFQRLWEGDEELFRAIPYHSIGKKSGILKGYLLPRLEVEMEGICRSFQDVYVAVSGECKVEMILNPCLLEHPEQGGVGGLKAARKNKKVSKR